MTVHVSIDRLVIAGLAVSRSDVARLEAGFREEMIAGLDARVLAAAFGAGAALAAVRAEPIAIPPSTTPAAVGRAIARSVCRALGATQGMR